MAIRAPDGANKVSKAVFEAWFQDNQPHPEIRRKIIGFSCHSCFLKRVEYFFEISKEDFLLFS